MRSSCAAHHSAVVEVIDELTDEQAEIGALVINRLADRLDELDRVERLAAVDAMR